jgi:hypothetical protein
VALVPVARAEPLASTTTLKEIGWKLVPEPIRQSGKRKTTVILLFRRLRANYSLRVCKVELVFSVVPARINKPRLTHVIVGARG